MQKELDGYKSQLSKYQGESSSLRNIRKQTALDALESKNNSSFLKEKYLFEVTSLKKQIADLENREKKHADEMQRLLEVYILY
jgi:hypothetical protein